MPLDPLHDQLEGPCQHLTRVPLTPHTCTAYHDPNPVLSFDGPWTMEKYIVYGNGGGSDNFFGRHYEPEPYFPTYALA